MMLSLCHSSCHERFPDPSFQQRQQTVATAPPPQNVRVVVTAPIFGEKPVHLQCPNCHADIRTTVDARLISSSRIS